MEGVLKSRTGVAGPRRRRRVEPESGAVLVTMLSCLRWTLAF